MELFPFEGLLIKLLKLLSKLLFPGPKCWYQQDIGLPTLLKKKPLCGCSLWIWLLNWYIELALLRLAWLSSRKVLGLWLLVPWAVLFYSLWIERVGSVWATLHRLSPPPPKQILLRLTKPITCYYFLLLETLKHLCFRKMLSLFSYRSLSLLPCNPRPLSLIYYLRATLQLQTRNSSSWPNFPPIKITARNKEYTTHVTGRLLILVNCRSMLQMGLGKV